MNIGLVIPFYNEKENLIFFVKEWEKYLSEKENIRDNLTFFFFDDGSKDSSSDAILENIKKINYKIIRKKILVMVIRVDMDINTFWKILRIVNLFYKLIVTISVTQNI